MVVGSADAKVFYPSLGIAFTKASVFHTSSFQILVLNTVELRLYLALNRIEMEMRDVGLSQFYPRRITSRGGPPNITRSTLDENNTKGYKPWLQVAEEPDDHAIRRMFTMNMVL